jgi:hypothetical protein
MASLSTYIPAHLAVRNRAIMDLSSYRRDDWRYLQLNEAVEDVLSKILRFGFDIDHIEVKNAAAHALCSQIITWAKVIVRAIPSCGDWKEMYDFTFEVLYAPDAVPGIDAILIGTEVDLRAKFQDPDLEQDYALQDKSIEKLHLADRALSLSKARNRLDILDCIFSRDSATNSLPLPLPPAQLSRKISYTYKLRKCLLSQVDPSGLLELEVDTDDDLEYQLYLIQIKLRRSDFRADTVIANQVVQVVQDWQTSAVVNRRPIYTGTRSHMLSCSRIVLSDIDPQGCDSADHPTLEQFRLTLLAALIGFNRCHTYDECTVASTGLTRGGVTLDYTDRVGYRDIINSTDSFIRNMVGKLLFQAMVAVGEQFIANFEEHQAALTPPLPHPGPLVVQGHDRTRISRNRVERHDSNSKLTELLLFFGDNQNASIYYL